MTLASVAVLVLQAQDPAEEWVRTFDGTAGSYDEARFVRLDAQNNVVMTGTSWSTGTAVDVVTRKYDPQGDLIWSHTWNNETYGFNDLPNDMEIAPNGDVVIIGDSKHTGDSQSLNADIFILVLDENGGFLWSDSLRGSGYMGSFGPIQRSFAADLEIADNGDIYVAGQVTGFNGNNQYDQAAVARFSPTGFRHYFLTLDNSTEHEWSDFARAIGVDAMGNAYINGVTTIDPTWRDHAVWKIDPDGNEEWMANFPGPDNNVSEHLEDILVDADGNSYSYGRHSGGNMVLRKLNTLGDEQWTTELDTIFPSGGASFTGPDTRLTFDMQGNIILVSNMASRIGVAKFSPAGDVLWVTYHGGDTQFSNEAYHVEVDGMDHIYVAGAYSNTGTSFDLACVKVAPDGSQVWDVWHNGPANGGDKGHSMAVGNDGAVYVAGVGVGYTASNGDMLLVKYMQDGVGVHDMEAPDLMVFPNPVTDVLSVISSIDVGPVNFELIDMQGRMIKLASVNRQGEIHQLDVSGVARSVYLLRMISPGGSTTARIVIN